MVATFHDTNCQSSCVGGTATGGGTRDNISGVTELATAQQNDARAREDGYPCAIYM